VSLISYDLPPQVTVPDKSRQFCRNPQCRAKLPAPVSNAREAFCSRGCHARFFRTRCRVCEGPIEQPARGTRLICNKAKCKSAWRAGFGFGRYHTLNRAESIQERPVNKGPKVAIDDDRARSWRIAAAGKALSANQYHCAIVGTAHAAQAADRANAAHWRRAEVNQPNLAPTVPISTAIVSTWSPAAASVSDPEDLSIPEFLRRVEPESIL
jgi:hypothetical protein